ncbi:hypothetical protein FGO68_gene8885 [Halteria grandinella]|uniref:Transmembrane protein n=1 Tax=Halteria grandinella TaxID=5974 RepID=A0A8J8T570_HALGN|nr:hypothetical protein FGO68_gene8885 [Halteria grandinella]
MKQAKLNQPNQIAVPIVQQSWKNKIIKSVKFIGSAIISCVGCIVSAILLLIYLICKFSIEQLEFNQKFFIANSFHKFWQNQEHRYELGSMEHVSMKWGIIDNYTISNPLADKMGPKQIHVEYDGQIYHNRPHGVGTIRCKQLSEDQCPIEFGSVQFQHGKLHGGPMFFKLQNGRRLYFEEFRNDAPIKSSILYDKQGEEELLTSIDNQIDACGSIMEISQHHHAKISDKEYSRQIQQKEITGTEFIGSEEVDQGQSLEMEALDLEELLVKLMNNISMSEHLSNPKCKILSSKCQTKRPSTQFSHLLKKKPNQLSLRQLRANQRKSHQFNQTRVSTMSRQSAM